MDVSNPERDTDICRLDWVQWCNEIGHDPAPFMLPQRLKVSLLLEIYCSNHHASLYAVEGFYNNIPVLRSDESRF